MSILIKYQSKLSINKKNKLRECIFKLGPGDDNYEYENGIAIRKFIFEAKSYKKFIKYLIKRATSETSKDTDVLLDVSELKSHYIMLKKYILPLKAEDNETKVFFSDFYLKISKSNFRIDENKTLDRVIDAVNELNCCSETGSSLISVLDTLIDHCDTGCTNLSLDDRITLSVLKNIILVNRDAYNEITILIIAYFDKLQKIKRLQSSQFNFVTELLTVLKTEELNQRKLKTIIQKKMKANLRIRDVIEGLLLKDNTSPILKKDRQHSTEPNSFEHKNSKSTKDMLLAEKKSALSIPRTTKIVSADDIHKNNSINELFHVTYKHSSIEDIQRFLERWDLDYNNLDKEQFFYIETSVKDFLKEHLSNKNMDVNLYFISTYILSSYAYPFMLINEYFYYKLKILK